MPHGPTTCPPAAVALRMLAVAAPDRGTVARLTL